MKLSAGVLIKVGYFVAGFILGGALGSFSKALADRSLLKISFKGRSYCPFCKNKLRWYDLFPIYSYIFLKGKCRNCHKKIGVEYPLVEMVVGLLIGYLFYQTFLNFKFEIFNFQFSVLILELVSKVFFICILTALFITDLKKMFIPDRIIIPAIKLGFILSLGIILYKVGYLYYYLSNNPIGKYLLPPHSDYFQRHAIITAQAFLLSVLTGLLIGGFFWGLIIITKGKGMGGGDVKLGAFMGLMLGFPGALIALLLSFLTGAVFSIVLIIFGKKSFGQTIPFGPFMVLGSLIVLFWGERILNWYLNINI